MGHRKFGITLLSTPEYYLFSDKEIRQVYYNLIKYIKYKYKDKDYDYSILIGLSNVDGKTVLNKIKSKGVGRPRNIFIPKNRDIGIRYVNWHLHIMICGAPLGTMVKDIEDYLQIKLNNKLFNEEFDKRVYDSPNFNKFYFRGCRNRLDLLCNGLSNKKNKEHRVPKCSLINLNVNRRKTRNKKEDYYNIMKYIEKQSILTTLIESKNFTIAYFDIAKELNLLAKPSNNFYNKCRNNKGLK